MAEIREVDVERLDERPKSGGGVATLLGAAILAIGIIAFAYSHGALEAPSGALAQADVAQVAER